jgi:hypothetical protein
MGQIRDIGIDTISADGKSMKVGDDVIGTLQIVNGSVTNEDLGTPKFATYQETFSVADMTDNTDDTGEIELNVSIPVGSVFVRSFITGVTGFAGDTSAVVTIGDGTDVDRYNTGTPNVFATATSIDAGVPSGTVYHATAIAPVVTITSATDFTDVVTDGSGEVTITLMWYQPV